MKLEDQLHLAFADCSVPDCADYPWEHPRFRSSVFRADQEFCGEGLRIPIWFQGEEQIGDEAVQVPIGKQTPVRLVQTALLHQCIEASDAIQRKVQEIKELEWFAADARAACFRAGAGDLQFGLLRAGVALLDLQFPSVCRETQEMGCQANPCTLSTSTQDGPGIRFIRKNLMDCPLQASLTKFMDEYLEDHGYGPVNEEDRSSHPFCRGPRVIGAVGEHFCSVSPIAPRTTPASEIQDFRDEDRELYLSCPFRGVHVLAYTKDTFPIVLPTCSGQSIITERLSRAMLEQERPLPKKDSLLYRSEFVRAQHVAVDPAAGGSSHESADVVQATVEPAEAADGACPPGAVQGGLEMDSCTEVEAAHEESAPSHCALRPLRTASGTDVPQAATELLGGGVRTKAQRKSPPPYVSDTAEEPPLSAMESFDFGGADVQTMEEPEEQDARHLRTVVLTIQGDVSPDTEGATTAPATTAPVKVSALPALQHTEDGRVLPPCTVSCFPAPHPDWVIEIGEKELNDLLPDDLPAVSGVKGNRSLSFLSMDLGKFLPKKELTDSETHLRTATKIQRALQKALVHPEVVKSLRPAPTADWHPGLLTIEDLRCLSKKERTALEEGEIQFFFPILQEHITGGTKGHTRKIQQYLLAGLVFGWYPIHFRQKKLAKGTIKDLESLSKWIKKYDGGSHTFQSSNSLVMCPFPDCLYMCSSQPHAVKHAMMEHYHTMMVCGSCLCHVAPTLASTVTVGCTTMSFKEHVLMCGGPAVQSAAGPSTGEEPSTSGAPAGFSASVAASNDADSANDNANSLKDNADGAGGASKASGTARTARKHRLAAVLGGGSYNSSDSDGSDAEGDATPSTKRRKLGVVLGIGGDSKKERASRWQWTGRE